MTLQVNSKGKNEGEGKEDNMKENISVEILE